MPENPPTGAQRYSEADVDLVTQCAAQTWGPLVPKTIFLKQGTLRKLVNLEATTKKMLEVGRTLDRPAYQYIDP
jgi:hypothetical protein